MIDWVTMKIPCDHDGNICSGVVAKVNREGNTEWMSMTWLPITGSYDSTIMIRSVSESTLEISGNPAKWLQGHNLFGTDDLVSLVWAFFCKLVKVPELNLKPTMHQLRCIKEGNYTVSRVDINRTYLLDKPDDVKTVIRTLGDTARMKHRGAGQFKGDTLYWGKGSKRWFLKCYDKGDEINSKKSNYPEELRIPQMLDIASRSLRFEETLKSNYLRETGLYMAFNWIDGTVKLLLDNAIGKLEMSTKFKLTDSEIQNLKPSERTAYYAWLGGADMKAVLPKTTFYRHRKTLMEFGVDIGIAYDANKVDDKIISLMDILQREPMSIPDWAYEQNLVAC